MKPFTDPEIDDTAPTVELPLRPRTSAPAPDNTPAPQTNSSHITQLEHKLLEAHIIFLKKVIHMKNATIKAKNATISKQNATIKAQNSPQTPTVKKLWPGVKAGVEVESTLDNGSGGTTWVVDFNANATAKKDSEYWEAIVAEVKDIAENKSKAWEAIVAEAKAKAEAGNKGEGGLWRSRAWSCSDGCGASALLEVASGHR
jgi:hypothetical protein